MSVKRVYAEDGKEKTIDTCFDQVTQVRPGANAIEPERCKEVGVMLLSHRRGGGMILRVSGIRSKTDGELVKAPYS
jgi:hypothetical protein